MSRFRSGKSWLITRRGISSRARSTAFAPIDVDRSEPHPQIPFFDYFTQRATIGYALDVTKLEYDRFGPWVLEINETDTVPELFQPHVEPVHKPLLSVKIPRPVERARARHLTHLYDYLLSLYATHLTILRRHGESVVTESVDYDDIEHIYSIHDLLRGVLRIVTPANSYEIPYSTVSSELMVRVLDFVRGFYVESDRVVAVRPSIYEKRESFSACLGGLLGEQLARNPKLCVVASQVEVSMAECESGRISRAFAGVTRKRLLESLHLCDGRELVVVDRGQAFRRGKQAVYEKNILYLPLTSIRDVEWSRESESSPLAKLTLRLCDFSYSYLFVQDNPWRRHYRRFLRDAVGR